MLKSIEKSKYTDWLANIVLVRKKDEKIRMCINFTYPSKSCHKDPSPLLMSKGRHINRQSRRLQVLLTLRLLLGLPPNLDEERRRRKNKIDEANYVSF